ATWRGTFTSPTSNRSTRNLRRGRCFLCPTLSPPPLKNSIPSPTSKRPPSSARFSTRTRRCAMYVRMVIGEVISDDHVRELVKIANEDLMIARHNGFQGSQTLQEEGGRMVVILTSWTTREECIAYHC